LKGATRDQSEEGMEAFLRDLAETGKPILHGAEPLPATGVAELLREWDGEARLRVAGRAPEFDPEWGRWGARVFVRLCQYLVFRELDEEQLSDDRERLAPPSGFVKPSAIWSVDVTFRFLPDLEHLARRAAERDPLLEWMGSLAAEWPLSSVGMSETEPDPARVDRILADPVLRLLYLERISARKDFARLEGDGVREAFAAAGGEVPELARENRSAKLEREPDS